MDVKERVKDATKPDDVYAGWLHHFVQTDDDFAHLKRPAKPLQCVFFAHKPWANQAPKQRRR
ncbi:hypothetical protein HNR44_001549 [Geomicrobium halophilum]|uniref:Uncharacterized protein n=1 Tax=Geomicrobium halophilum TaxID=549000 RepID=A0A841PLF7_9BACL|nr:hypothetical protein [Geomicrobium halophilum]MBB6449600.1 hypothetical protein [Geomicrobium halophilum]